jgi:protein phosphatase
MGGHPGGEVASSVAISLVEASYSGRSLDELEAGVRAANRAIWDRADADAELEGMGTTFCAVGLTESGDLAVVNVGDSRAYLQRKGVVEQVTADHSLTADLVRRGELLETEVRDHPQRGVITRVLGGGPTVEVDGATYPVEVGDRVLVCSDGLFNELHGDEIVALLAETGDLQSIVDRLVEVALERGGSDNISVVLAEVTG